MTYDDIRAILGRGSVRAVEDAVNEAVIASRLEKSEAGYEALELLMTAQLAAVLSTEPAKAQHAIDRAVMRLRVLVAEALAVQGALPDNELRIPPQAPARTTTLN